MRAAEIIAASMFIASAEQSPVGKLRHSIKACLHYTSEDRCWLLSPRSDEHVEPQVNEEDCRQGAFLLACEPVLICTWSCRAVSSLVCEVCIGLHRFSGTGCTLVAQFSRPGERLHFILNWQLSHCGGCLGMGCLNTYSMRSFRPTCEHTCQAASLQCCLNSLPFPWGHLWIVFSIASSTAASIAAFEL